MNLAELGESATLALEVVEESRKGDKVLIAGSRWAVIDLRHMCGRVEVLIKSLFAAELAIAEIAFPLVSVKRIVRGPSLSRVVVMPFQEILSNEASLIATANKVVYALSIRVLVWARIRLEVVGEAARRCEASLAKGAFDVASAMDAGVAMLRSREQTNYPCSCRLYHVQVVLVLERSLAALAVELMSGRIVMVIYATLIEELRRTGIADPVLIPMLCVVHVLHYSFVRWKALVARVAFVITHLECVSCY